jgi:hypothetical protein
VSLALDVRPDPRLDQPMLSVTSGDLPWQAFWLSAESVGIDTWTLTWTVAPPAMFVPRPAGIQGF